MRIAVVQQTADIADSSNEGAVDAVVEERTEHVEAADVVSFVAEDTHQQRRHKGLTWQMVCSLRLRNQPVMQSQRSASRARFIPYPGPSIANLAFGRGRKLAFSKFRLQQKTCKF